MKLAKYLKPITAILIVIVIVLGLALRAQIDEKNEVIERTNMAYEMALLSASWGLDVNYKKLEHSDKVYYYTKLTSSLQSAATVFPQTEYAKINQDFGYTLKRLNVYFSEQYALNELDIDGERQAKLNKYLSDICSNPSDKKLMDELVEYNYSFNKPTPPDSLSYKMK